MKPFLKLAMVFITLGVLAGTSSTGRAQDAKPLSQAQAVALFKKLLAEKDPAKKAGLLEQAGQTTADDPVPFIKALAARPLDPAPKKGIQTFALDVPAPVSPKAVEVALSVPGKYAPNRLWPLIIGLHGGGENLGSGVQHMTLCEPFTSLDTFIACPTSVDLTVKYYWRSDRNVEMLRLLVQELSRRFTIDPDRVYLSGYSMGGFGSYSLGVHMPDRFAAVAPGGGAWRGLHWEAMLNTPVYLWHGKNDLRGPNFTDFPNAQKAADILKSLGYDHELRAMDCEHGPVPENENKRMAEWLLQKKRNAYPKRIVTASPRVFPYADELQTSPPDRWLAIDEVGPEKLDMEGLEPGGTVRVKRPHRMGALDASWTQPNVLEVKARNVKRFRVFLSPRLLGLKKPLKILVNGKVVFEGEAKTSLRFLLEYLDTHRDPGLVFVGAVPVQVPSD